MIKDVMIDLLSIFHFVVWVMGWVLAKGFWSTVAAVLFPPWAWYLTAEFFISKL